MNEVRSLGSTPQAGPPSSNERRVDRKEEKQERLSQQEEAQQAESRVSQPSRDGVGENVDTVA